MLSMPLKTVNSLLRLSLCVVILVVLESSSFSSSLERAGVSLCGVGAGLGKLLKGDFSTFSCLLQHLFLSLLA